MSQEEKKNENIDQEQEETANSETKEEAKQTEESREASVEDVVEEKDSEIKMLQDKYQRLLAEFENARKRTAKESAHRYDMGAMAVLEKLLPIIDNFERGLEAVSEEERGSAFVQGIEQIYKQLLDTMEDLGVIPMDACGKEFDAQYHNAVMHVDDDELGDNIVAEEMQKGYLYKDSVLRHSMVKVAN